MMNMIIYSKVSVASCYVYWVCFFVLQIDGKFPVDFIPQVRVALKQYYLFNATGYTLCK